MLTVSSSLQTGDPGLEAGHLRFLEEQKLTRLDGAAGYDPRSPIKLVHNEKHMGCDSAPA